jgi:hypothetical protein
MQCFEEIIPMFRPCARLITSITTASPAVVVTRNPHGYSSGIIVRLDIPEACGMQEANTLTGEITVIDLTSFSIGIDTIGFTPFVIPTVFLPTPGGIPEWVNICAQVIPIGDATTGDHADETSLAPKNINRRQQGYYNNVPMKDWR